MAVNYKVKFLNEAKDIQQGDSISAVFLVGLKDDKILAARNERGWDLPGGHIEKGEGLLEGLHRELQEEAGATVRNPQPFALLSILGHPKSMLFYASRDFELGDFTPKVDAFERAIMSIPELLMAYHDHGDALLLRGLIEKAAQVLGE